MYLIGDYGTYPHGSSKNTIDGLNIDSNQWELPGTFPLAGNATTLTSSSGIVAGSFCYDPVARKAFWGSDGTYWYWTPGAATKSAHPSQSAMTYLRRFPNRWDPLRNAFFGIEWGDSQGASSGVTASQIINPSSATPTARSITFNASAAYTQFQNDEPAYPGMDYDVLRDRFVFFAAGTYSNGGIATFDPFRLYEITPNSSSVWDMSTVTINSGGVTPVDTPSSGSGVNGRFRYVSRGGVGGFLYLPNQSSSLYFFRTS
jgi:hypothetical protein